jgi:hypothetical protein
MNKGGAVSAAIAAIKLIFGIYGVLLLLFLHNSFDGSKCETSAMIRLLCVVGVFFLITRFVIWAVLDF